MKYLIALAEITGLGLVIVGFWLAWPPLAYLVGGLALILIGNLLARRSSP